MRPGKNVTSKEPYFTSLETLYELNIELLNSAERRNRGWGPHADQRSAFERFRPSEDVLDDLFAELITYWDALLEILPILHRDPLLMRDHFAPRVADLASADGSWDSPLFWPVAQIRMAKLARELLNELAVTNNSTVTLEDATAVLRPLADVNWDAHAAPWRHIFLIQDERQVWKIASEGRKMRLDLIEDVIRWQIGIVPRSEDELYGPNGLKSRWHGFLLANASSEAAELWDEILEGISR